MVADSIDELHRFAVSVQLKRHWYDSNDKHPHYDVPQWCFQRCVDAGAVVVDVRRVLAVAKASIR